MPATDNPKIRVAVSDPKLKDKIKIDLSGPLDTVYWFIRFNIPLDESTVNEKNMEVTDTEGYIMRTDISYQGAAHRIVISPLDSYEEQRYYLLKVSKKVRSEKGQNLKTVISILFKLYQGQISEYKILKKDVPVPPSKPRPKNYDERQKERIPNDLDNYVENLPRRSKMAPDSVSFNPLIGILGIVTVFMGFVMGGNVIAIIAGMVICALGAAHVYMQWQNKVFRAKMHYNKGVRYFNKMQYRLAKTRFEKALDLNPSNELAKYGLVRVGIYK
ncbi:MAG: tetratricopeptide repeat protein [Clostridiales bacterium]|jgi:tetratricopeptide (TPR) repeat protein|nr:tetratricopeptide repeat protein [Clostridiales bacterium]